MTSCGSASCAKDQFKIVTGPVSIPFTKQSVSDCAYTLSFTVIGFSQDTSPKISGGFTQREPYDCTHPYSVTVKPLNFSPKYSTISFRSNSPWTKTSKSSSSCIPIQRLILSFTNCS